MRYLYSFTGTKLLVNECRTFFCRNSCLFIPNLVRWFPKTASYKTIPHLATEDVWFKVDLCLWYIHHINLRYRIFLAKSKMTAPNLENVRQKSVCMTNSSKVLIYFLLFYSSSAKGNISKSNISELWNCLSYRMSFDLNGLKNSSTK